MNRVWKKFFRKLAEPLGLMAYIMFAIGLTLWTAENVSEGWSVIVGIIMLPVPMFAYLVCDMWRQAKSEVEWENRTMLNTLKGK